MKDETKKNISNFEKFANWFSKIGGFFGNQRHFATIRDAFGTFMPLIIVGSFGVLIDSVFVNPTGLLATLCGSSKGNSLYLSWSHVSFYLGPIFTGISGATLSFFSIYMAFLFGYFLAGTYKENKIFGGLISLAAFLTFNPIAAGGNSPTLFLGTQGLLIAIFCGLTAPMILTKLNQVKIFKINMPDGVPPAVAASFTTLIPMILTVAIYAIIQPVWGAIAIASGIGGTMSNINISIYYLFGAVYKFLFLPFNDAAGHWSMIIVILMLIGLFWFFGIHGNNVVLPFVNAFWTTATLANVAVLAKYGSLNAALSSGELALWTEQTMNSFALMGGASSTLALIIGLLVYSKIPQQQKITKLALPPGIFNISEPMMFGLPIILNPMYFIPFLITGAIQGMIAYLFTMWGFMHPVTVMLPWTTPIFISGFLSTQDWRSIIVTLINLAIAIALYFPFIMFDVKSQNKNKQKTVKNDAETVKKTA